MYQHPEDRVFRVFLAAGTGSKVLMLEGLLEDRVCSGALPGRCNPVPVPYSELAKARYTQCR
jgi:hypothetical protein